MRALALLVSAVVLLASPARLAAEPHVVVLSRAASGDPEGFVAALRVQIGTRATIVTREPEASALGQQFQTASALVARGEADLVVWTAPSDAPNEFVVFAVGRDDNRALVELVRLEAGERPDDQRIMALKVANLLDAILTAAPAAASAGPSTSTSTSTSTSNSVVDAFVRALPARRSRLALGIDAFGATGSGSADGQLGLALAAGPTFRWPHLHVDGYAFFRVVGSDRDTAMSGSVKRSELAFGGGAAARLPVGPGAIGADLGLGARLVDADGSAEDGRTESAQRVVPFVRGALEGRFAPLDRLEIRALAGVEAALIRQQFSVLDQPVSDLGRVRMVGEIGLVLLLP